METGVARVRHRRLLESVWKTVLLVDDQNPGGDVQRQRQHTVQRVRPVEKPEEQSDGELARRGRFQVLE